MFSAVDKSYSTILSEYDIMTDAVVAAEILVQKCSYNCKNKILYISHSSSHNSCWTIRQIEKELDSQFLKLEWKWENGDCRELRHFDQNSRSCGRFRVCSGQCLPMVVQGEPRDHGLKVSAPRRAAVEWFTHRAKELPQRTCNHSIVAILQVTGTVNPPPQVLRV